MFVMEVHFQISSYVEYLVNMCGLVEKCRTHNHKTISVVSSSPATAGVFVSLGKMLRLNCSVDLSVLGR